MRISSLKRRASVVDGRPVRVPHPDRRADAEIEPSTPALTTTSNWSADHGYKPPTPRCVVGRHAPAT